MKVKKIGDTGVRQEEGVVEEKGTSGLAVSGHATNVQDHGYPYCFQLEMRRESQLGLLDSRTVV